MQLQKQNGFTLIELIIVIVILGVLVAVVIPKFVDLSTSARIASLKNARGVISSALNRFHSKTVVLGIDGKSTPLTLDGVRYWNHWGYPHIKNNSNDTPGIVHLSGIDLNQYELLYKDVIGHPGTDLVTISPKGAKDSNTCFVSVLQAIDADTPPVLDEDFDGC